MHEIVQTHILMLIDVMAQIELGNLSPAELEFWQSTAQNIKRYLVSTGQWLESK